MIICYYQIDGQVVLRFASAYGFRNIQNIVQKLKRKKCTYHYIEVMACPSGCLNGGGQIKDSDGNAQSISKATLESVEASYNSSKHRSPDDNPYMASLYQDWLGKGTEPDKVKLLLHTQYHAVPKMSHSLNIKW
jgi:iron only hydrogenase large subunit-like protein